MTVEINNVLAAVKCNSHEALITTVYGEDSSLVVKFILNNIVYDKDVQAPACYIRRDNGQSAKTSVNGSAEYAGANWELDGTHDTQQIPKEAFKVTAKSSSELNGNKVFDYWTAVEGSYPTPPTTSVPDTYSGTPSTAYAVCGSTYIIYTAEQLMGFAQATLSNNFNGKTVKLANDIIINTGVASGWDTTAPAYNWECSSSWGNRFAGTFDGQGHTVSGVYSNIAKNTGFFQVVDVGSTIKNLNIVNSYFSATHADDKYAGGLIGYLDCASGTVGGTYTISNVYVDAIVKASAYAGGLIGRDSNNNRQTTTIIENCAFTGEVYSRDGKAGGICGHIRSTKNIIGCSVNGNISGNGNNVGGIVGLVESKGTETVTISNCIVNADLSAYESVGGLIGRVKSAQKVSVSNCLIEADISVGTDASNTTAAGVIGYYETKTADGSSGNGTAEISNTLISVRGEKVLAAVLGFWGNTTLTVTLDNVKYDSNRFNGNKMRDVYLDESVSNLLTKNYNVNEDLFGMTTAELNGKAIFDGWTAVKGDYPVPAAKSIDPLKTFVYENYGKSTEILGYQTKDNGNGTYGARLIATLTNKLDGSYVAAGFKDITVTLTNGQVKVIPVYYCLYSYNSVIGGGVTYNAGDYLSDKFFCLTIDNAPAEIASIEATPFVMMSESAEPVCGEAVSWTLGEVKSAEEITVMSLNVYLHDDKDPDGDGPKTADDRINAIKAQVLAQDPDVLCVQEDNWTQKLDALLTTNGYTAVRGKAISRSGWTGFTYESYEYQTIYFKTAKFELVSSGQKWLSDSPDTPFSDSYGNDDTRPRGINYAELTSTNGESFYVFNVHLENADPTTRMNQANKLIDLVGTIAGDTPAILCGDFNLISNSSDENDKSSIASLKGVYDDTRLVADLTETHATFINAEGTIFGAANTTATPTSGTIIDYCFTSKDDFNVYSYDVISEKQDGIYTSDHLPLVIKLSINSVK